MMWSLARIFRSKSLREEVSRAAHVPVCAWPTSPYRFRFTAPHVATCRPHGALTELSPVSSSEPVERVVRHFVGNGAAPSRAFQIRLHEVAAVLAGMGDGGALSPGRVDLAGFSTARGGSGPAHRGVSGTPDASGAGRIALGSLRRTWRSIAISATLETAVLPRKMPGAATAIEAAQGSIAFLPPCQNGNAWCHSASRGPRARDRTPMLSPCTGSQPLTFR